MSKSYIVITIAILFEIYILFVGCNGGKWNPLAPDNENEQKSQVDITDTTQQLINRNTAANFPVLWGYYRMSYNSSTRELDAVPLRGVSFALNVTKFLQPPAGSATGVTVGILDDHDFTQTGNIDVRVLLHHPFPNKDIYTGFDVMGIFITEGSQNSPYDSTLNYAAPGVDPILLNPDGYTRWMNPSEFLSGDIFGYFPGMWGTSESSENSGFLAGARLNPYKYFAQGLASNVSLEDWVKNPLSTSNRGMFPSGATCSRDYKLNFPIVNNKINFVFNYAILANWAEPEIDPPTNPLTDFPMTANAGWPLHILPTDKSSAYWTQVDAGGVVAFDIQIFDWDGTANPKGIPGEISKFILWSNDPLLPSGYAEIMSEEVEWNSGFTASTSVAHIEVLGAVPEKSGPHDVWIEIVSKNPSSYDQGFGVIVPDGTLAGYVKASVDVKACPKAGAGGVAGGEADSGDYMDDAIVTGDNFMDGPELGVWLELPLAGGEGGETEPIRIYGTDIKYINENTLTADFDLTDAKYGDYGIGCTNGCGLETTPEENKAKYVTANVQINLKKPSGITLSTGRTGPTPSALANLYINWTSVPQGGYYNIWAKVYDINGNLIIPGTKIGSSTTNTAFINLSSLPTGGSGVIETWVTSLPDPIKNEYESKASKHAWAYIQNFEISLGNWTFGAENSAQYRFIRSAVNCSYGGTWGVKVYGKPADTPYDWVFLASPSIPDLDGPSTVRVEMVHRVSQLVEDSGYQVGWLQSITQSGASVSGYHPFPATSGGQAYNDTDSLALRTDFGLSTYTDNNWQYDSGSNYFGWYFSAFDASEILSDGINNYITLALAAAKDCNHDMNVDDIAILIY